MGVEPMSPGLEAGILPLDDTELVRALAAGFSIAERLSERREKIGPRGWFRPSDLRFFGPALYQLSYPR